MSTEHTRLSEISIEHAEDLFEIYSDPKVCNYFDINPFKNSR